MSNLICPVCHTGEIVETERTYKCADNHYPPQAGDCQFLVWKDCLKNFGKAKVTAAEIVKLTAGKQIPLKLKSKAGKPFECTGELEQVPGKPYHSVKLIFQERSAGKPVAIPAAKSASTDDQSGSYEDYEENILEDC